MLGTGGGEGGGGGGFATAEKLGDGEIKVWKVF